MHLSALLHVRRALKKHLCADPLLMSRSPLRVVEIGSADINGSNRGLFDSFDCTYHGVDLEAGPGVDTVLDDPYLLPFGDGTFDVALATQVFEHAEHFWRMFGEMARIVDDDGVIIVMAPSAGPIRRFPVDCYRFNPDSMNALARHTGLHLAEVVHSEFGPWFDVLGVFRKRADVSVPTSTLDVGRALDQAVQNSHPEGLPADIEHGSGTGTSYELLTMMHSALDPRFYAEIGVEQGFSFLRTTCPSLGIDPAPALTTELPDTHRLCTMTSDDFFWLSDERASVRDLDLAYVDGMHQLEYAVRDFMYFERLAHPGTVIVIDDIYPSHPLQGERTRQSRFWTGDVWKIVGLLRSVRPDLILLPVDTYPSGSLIVIGCDPGNRALWGAYDIVVDGALQDRTPIPDDHIQRIGSFAIDDPMLTRVLRLVREARGSGDMAASLERLRGLLAGCHPRRVVVA